MVRKLLFVAVAAGLVGAVGCRHRCRHQNDADRAPPAYLPPGARNPVLLPPAGLPTTPVPSVGPQPGPSNFPPPALDVPPGPAPRTGPDVLFPDPLPGSSSARPTQPGAPGLLGAPVKPQTAEPPKSAPAGPGLTGYTKVKDGLFAGRKPTLDGFDALKGAGFRAVVYLHRAGADVAAVRDLAATRGLGFHAIEATPETLADALPAFNRVAADRLNRPAFVFGDDDVRAGAVWYLHLRTVDSLGDDAARLRAKPLGLSEASAEGRAFALAIQRVLETK